MEGREGEGEWSGGGAQWIRSSGSSKSKQDRRRRLPDSFIPSPRIHIATQLLKRTPAGISNQMGLRSAPIATQSETLTTTHSARPATLCLLIRCFRAAKRLIMSKGESVGRSGEGKGWLASEERGGRRDGCLARVHGDSYVQLIHYSSNRPGIEEMNITIILSSNLRQLEKEKVGNEFAV